MKTRMARGRKVLIGPACVLFLSALAGQANADATVRFSVVDIRGAVVLDARAVVLTEGNEVIPIARADEGMWVFSTDQQRVAMIVEHGGEKATGKLVLSADPRSEISALVRVDRAVADVQIVDGPVPDVTRQILFTQKERQVAPPNDACTDAISVADGQTVFSNVDATTDGPDEPAMCGFFGYTQIDSDVWFCYTASCSDEVAVSLCGSDYDTKMAVYEGCGCPTTAPIACNDDDCDQAVQSRVTFQAVTGQSYLIRVGGFQGEQGNGLLAVACGADACATSTNDCFAASPDNTPGCSDSACCQSVCASDSFCCDVEWDDFCVGLAGTECAQPAGACCNHVTGACSDDVLQQDCTGDQLEWFQDAACAAIGCAAIPTVSEWGLVAMTLLVLTAGTVAITRQRLWCVGRGSSTP